MSNTIQFPKDKVLEKAFSQRAEEMGLTPNELMQMMVKHVVKIGSLENFEIDDSYVTDAEKKAIKIAMEELERGEVYSHEEVLQHLEES